MDEHRAVEIFLFSNTLNKHMNIKTGSKYFFRYWKLLQYILWLIKTINHFDVNNLQQLYRKWSIKRRQPNKRRTFNENHLITAALELAPRRQFEDL